jgi:hypothetical protein
MARDTEVRTVGGRHPDAVMAQMGTEKEEEEEKVGHLAS